MQGLKLICWTMCEISLENFSTWPNMAIFLIFKKSPTIQKGLQRVNFRYAWKYNLYTRVCHVWSWSIEPYAKRLGPPSSPNQTPVEFLIFKNSPTIQKGLHRVNFKYAWKYNLYTRVCQVWSWSIEPYAKRLGPPSPPNQTKAEILTFKNSPTIQKSSQRSDLWCA